MGPNSLLDAHNGSELPSPGPDYDRHMDSNGQFVQAPPPWQQATPAAAPARRWIPAAIIAAAILVGLLGGAAILRHGKTDTPATPVTTQAADGKTCQAWKTARASIVLAPDLPQGWNWDTPGIDSYIAKRVEMTNAALDIFDPVVAAAQPSDPVAGGARDFIMALRREMQQLTGHTFTGGHAASPAAYRLDALCGVGE